MSNSAVHRRVFVIVAVISILGPSLADAQAVDNLLSGLEQRANSVITNAGEQGRGVAMEAGQSALNAIGAFRAVFKESLDQTVNGLTEAERRSYEDVLALVTASEESLQAVTADLTGITERLNSFAASLPLGTRLPALLAVSPQYFVTRAQPIRVEMKGLNLAYGDPILQIGTRGIFPTRELDNALQFDLPPSLLRASRPGGVVRGTLRVFEKQRSYLIFSKLVAHTYRVALYPLPETIGTYQLAAKREVSITDREQRRTGEFRCDSPRGDGTNHKSVSITAREGWRIDPQTITYHRTYSNHGGHSFGSQGSSGFTASLRCEGWGKVVVLGVVVDHGSIGVEKGYYTYTELRERLEQVIEPKRAGALRWGETVLVPDLPIDTMTITLEFQPFAGPPTAAQGHDLSSPYFILDYNAVAQTAKLTARRPDQALAR